MRKLQGAGNRASGEINHTHDPHENNHMSPQNGCHTVPLIDDWSCQWLIRSALSLSFARIPQPLEVCCIFPCKLCNSKKFFILNTRMIEVFAVRRVFWAESDWNWSDPLRSDQNPLRIFLTPNGRDRAKFFWADSDQKHRFWADLSRSEQT